MEHLHYAIIIIAVVGIIFFQISFFKQNRTKLNLLKRLFPSNINGQLTTTDNEGITTINVQGQSSPIFTEIVNTINNYLVENKGAASDFHLIKDVVDRNCDSVEEEITTLTPIPLYFGLIGTMLGILVGVAFLVFTGDIDALLSSNSDTASGGIVELLGGVALAMISSIAGIGLTTYGSYLTKGAKNQLNSDKNKFLSWIQVKLLPSLSDNATSAIHTLQNNLSKFNFKFSENIEGMNDAFAVVGQSYKDQLELMTLLKDLDIHKMATANVQVLKELQKSTGEFERFNQYLHNVSSYIENVQKLNSGINEHLQRTQVIEQMGVFFREEIQQIESRKGLINSVAGQIDETLNSTLTKLEESAEKQLAFFIEKSVTLQEKFSSAIEAQAETANQVTADQRAQFNAAIDEQAAVMQGKLKETSMLLDEMKNLKDVKQSMDGVESAMREHNGKLDKLISALSNNYARHEVGGVEPGSIQAPISPAIKISIIATCITVGVAALLFIGTTIINLTSDNNPQGTVKVESSSSQENSNSTR